MQKEKRPLLPAIKPYVILAIIKLFSWPAFFGTFRFIQRLCLHAMNRTSAGFLPVTRTGEQHALRKVLSGLSGQKEIVLFDCGANLGEYCDMAIAECGKVGIAPVIHIFEPTKYCHERLAAKFGNKAETIKLHKLAVSASSGRASIYFPWPGAGGASLSPETNRIQGTLAHGQQSEEITTVSIDEFCALHRIPIIHLLKLDIEGHELSALVGAKKMIEAKAIGAIQFELGSAALSVGSTLYDFWKLLAGKFDFYLVLGNGLVMLREYKADLECFFAGSNFLLLRKIEG